MTRISHTSFTVSDLDRSIAFYRDLLGLELRATIRRNTGWIAAMTGFDGADLRIAALVEPGGGHVLELIEYVSPSGAAPRPIPTNDVGAAHVCFEVDDLQAEAERLRAAGVVFVGEVVQVTEPPGVGGCAAYFRDPDGIPLELHQPPPPA
jgi:catechol 2,3-dioxygenase-like lactoylglutathione lyase family enzyme